MGTSIFGNRVPRVEDPKLLTAGGTYVADLRIPELEGAASIGPAVVVVGAGQGRRDSAQGARPARGGEQLRRPYVRGAIHADVTAAPVLGCDPRDRVGAVVRLVHVLPVPAARGPRAPGVLHAEPYRRVAARLRAGHFEERASITGQPLDASLSRLVNAERKPVVPVPGGLVLSRDLAEKLHVAAGDLLEVAVTEGRRPVLTSPVAAVTTTFIGSDARMLIHELNAALQEGAVISGANLLVDASLERSLYAELEGRPAVAGIALQREAERNFTELMDQSIGLSVWVYTAFAALIAVGVVYNTVRISFAERQRELASLRVLGFTRGEVSYILLGEIAFLTLAALPLGAALGAVLAWALAQAMSSELFRLPFVIDAGTFGYAAVVVVVVTAVSALLVRRQLDRMDLVGVLKSRD